jgi:ADP-ribose pyrophosphatase YjhB (NUDIX family)
MQNRRVAARGVILKDGKILGVRLKKYKGRATDDGQDYWCTPGGGVDVGEPLIPALEREMIEETGIKPVVGNLLYIQQFEHKEWEHLEFFFHITNSDDYENVDIDKTTHGAIEIAEIGFINPAECTLLPIFLTKQDLVSDAEQSVTKFFNNFAE